VAHHLHVLVVKKMGDIAARPREKVVNAEDIVALSSSLSQRCDPRKPAPPVTSTRLSIDIENSGL